MVLLLYITREEHFLQHCIKGNKISISLTEAAYTSFGILITTKHDRKNFPVIHLSARSVISLDSCIFESTFRVPVVKLGRNNQSHSCVYFPSDTIMKHKCFEFPNYPLGKPQLKIFGDHNI